jgi:hypothetical protein
MLEELTNAFKSKKKKTTENIENRLNDAWDNDPKSRTFLKSLGYNPEKSYGKEELFVYLTYLGHYMIKRTAGAGN